MNFDQMMDAWKVQDERPLYGVNRDLLQLVLQHEQAEIRRTLRRDQWMTYIMGPGMALFGAFWVWVAILKGAPLLHTVAAGAGAAAFALWVGAYWLSRRRQAQRERGFGNSLRDEIGRNLSLVEYQLRNGSRGRATLWIAPVMLGALLIYWLTFQINTSSGFSWWNHAIIVLATLWFVTWLPYAGSRAVEQKFGPRRDRLRALLTALDASE